VDLGGPHQQAVFAFLALHAPRPVTTDALIEAVWGDAAPSTARKTPPEVRLRASPWVGRGRRGLARIAPHRLRPGGWIPMAST
jgi:hypothetical protein